VVGWSSGIDDELTEGVDEAQTLSSSSASFRQHRSASFALGVVRTRGVCHDDVAGSAELLSWGCQLEIGKLRKQYGGGECGDGDSLSSAAALESGRSHTSQ